MAMWLRRAGVMAESKSPIGATKTGVAAWRLGEIAR